MTEPEVEQERICPHDGCGRKITEEVYEIMNEGKDYCDCEKAERIIELTEEVNQKRKDTLTEIKELIYKHQNCEHYHPVMIDGYRQMVTCLPIIICQIEKRLKERYLNKGEE